MNRLLAADTAWDLEAFGRNCVFAGPPFRWNEARRFLLRCELDAACILDTFPIVKRKDTRTGQPNQTRLDPPPADPAVAYPPRNRTDE